jgi:hypothetical protein
MKALEGYGHSFRDRYVELTSRITRAKVLGVNGKKCLGCMKGNLDLRE